VNQIKYDQLFERVLWLVIAILAGFVAGVRGCL